jgi:rod shape determining protein RodA
MFLSRVLSLIKRLSKQVDWILVGAIVPVLLVSLLTMNSFTGDGHYFSRQLVWIGISTAIFFIFSFVDFRFLRRSGILVTLFVGINLLLILLFIIGQTTKGAQSWFQFGLFSIQPSDPAKVVLILILAKYFSRRHIEIANIRHIFVSGIYAFIIFFLVLLQPDFGSAVIIFLIWFGMVLVSGISKRHVIGVFLIGLTAFSGLWLYGFKDYQKARIKTFVNPLADIRGAGYNAYQSTIAVGSGQVVGKGIGYGTQSRLQFLPEYQTDFIFAAFAEEWGFIGVLILFALYAVIMFRILSAAYYGDSNFETLFGLGVGILFLAHLFINVGMNIGLLPITGTTIPLMSYGGSHLITELGALGILMGMRGYRKTARKDMIHNEFIGPA